MSKLCKAKNARGDRCINRTFMDDVLGDFPDFCTGHTYPDPPLEAEHPYLDSLRPAMKPWDIVKPFFLVNVDEIEDDAHLKALQDAIEFLETVEFAAQAIAQEPVAWVQTTELDRLHRGAPSVAIVHRHDGQRHRIALFTEGIRDE